MLRRVLFFALLFGAATAPIVAQEGPTPNRIYIATYMVNYGNIPEYQELYETQGVPILDELVEEGMLVGFNFRMHHTGGEYTLREGLIGDPDTDFDAVWAAYNGRWEERHPAGFERLGAIIDAHEDEVWNLEVLNLGDGGGAQYLYEIYWQVNFNDLDAWTRVWEEEVFPIMDGLIEQGLLSGYVQQGHNTGGRFNTKVAMLYDEWDDLDEIEAAFFSALALDNPAWAYVQSHKDELWQNLPPR
ncbi:MAG: hypothetical protein OEU54_02785 [Gemmatimonadota bacterium]|nr:hypothetical protein [Gemmatimonadota bacterium]